MPIRPPDEEEVAKVLPSIELEEDSKQSKKKKKKKPDEGSSSRFVVLRYAPLILPLSFTLDRGSFHLTVGLSSVVVGSTTVVSTAEARIEASRREQAELVQQLRQPREDEKSSSGDQKPRKATKGSSFLDEQRDKYAPRGQRKANVDTMALLERFQSKIRKAEPAPESAPVDEETDEGWWVK